MEKTVAAFFVLLSPLTLDRDRVVRDFNVDIRLGNPGKLGPDDEPVITLEDLDGWRPTLGTGAALRESKPRRKPNGQRVVRSPPNPNPLKNRSSSSAKRRSIEEGSPRGRCRHALARRSLEDAGMS